MLKRAPDICPYWPSGKHTQVLIRRFFWQRPRVVYVCPRCDGWYPRETARFDGQVAP